MKKILLIDDDQNLCNFLSSYLVSFNFFVDSVNSIRNALAYIRNDCPDVVISDIIMQGFNGYDFIKLLKLDNLYIHIPVIFFTAKGITSDRIKGYNLGCYAYLTKPFDLKELIAIICNIFNQIKLLCKSNLIINSKFFCDSNLLDFFNLTKREKNVLTLVLENYTDKKIAISLDVSQRNIEKYISRLFNKTNTRNRIELIRLFLRANDGIRTRV
uniref:hypothetical protein n=1 Tax=Pterosiphonia complanata TaxID=884089 RepID=UPI0022FD85E4|nr:hypothetical protein PNW47_pgp015 [Pterosiphonia complanata]WAX03180.1 hypothetical protein [Pterosiphonia complanata]